MITKTFTLNPDDRIQIKNLDGSTTTGVILERKSIGEKTYLLVGKAWDPFIYTDAGFPPSTSHAWIEKCLVEYDDLSLYAKPLKTYREVKQ